MAAASPPLPKEDLQHVLDLTAPLWEEARSARFFITGGTGFFGMWLLESFCHINETLGLGASATVLTRDRARFATKAPHLVNRPDLQFVEGDIKDFAFPEGEFSYVVHAATEASAKLNENEPLQMLDATISGTRRVLEFVAQSTCRKLLLTSSGAVYGRQPADVTHVPETYEGGPNPLSPGSAYAEGKRVSEFLCATFAAKYGFECKIARCFAFIGPHLPLDAHFAIGNFLRDALEGSKIKVGGDGSPLRSYLYASDLAVWLWTVLFSGSHLEAYNVGSEEAFSISDIANIVSTAVGNGCAVEIAKPRISGPVSQYVPSVKKAASQLGLVARVSLPQAVRNTAEWISTTRRAKPVS